MEIARILVPQFGADEDEEALRGGFVLGLRFAARIDCAFVESRFSGYVPGLGDDINPALITQIHRVLEEEAAKRRQSSRARFESARESAGLPLSCSSVPGEASCRWLELPRSDPPALERAGRLSDLIIFGVSPASPSVEWAATCEALLFGTGRPLLLISEACAVGAFGHVAIGWDDSAVATRAVAAAMPFLARAETVHVVTVAEKAQGEEMSQGLVEYLRLHGIASHPWVTPPGSSAAGEALVNAAAGLKAQLLVVGGFGHSRIRELILGGVSRHLLGHPPMPVLMVH